MLWGFILPMRAAVYSVTVCFLLVYMLLAPSPSGWSVWLPNISALPFSHVASSLPLVVGFVSLQVVFWLISTDVSAI